MDKITKSLVSVENHQNKSDVKNTRLDETHPQFPNPNAVCRRSKNSSLVNFCKESSAKICDEKNMKIFNTFANQGRLSS